MRNSAIHFMGRKGEYNAQLCLMKYGCSRLTGVIKSKMKRTVSYYDAHNLDGCCDYVMANPPFNVEKVKAESCEGAKRLPFGMPSVNKKKRSWKRNTYLWISYFYTILNETAGALFMFVFKRTAKARQNIVGN